MAKMKIYEISRSLQGAFPDLKSKDLIKLLQENGFQVKSAQSSIEDDAISFLLNKFKGSAKKAEPVKETEEVVKTESAPKKEVKEKAEPKKKEEAKTEEKKEQTKKTVEETPVKEKTAEKETEKKEEKPEPVKKEEEKKEEPKKEEKAPAAQKAQEKKPVSENRPEQNNRRDNRDNRNGQGGRDNRDNRDRRDGGRRDNRDNRNGQGGRDNRGDNRNRGNGQGGYNRDNRNGQGGRDNRGDNRNRGNGQGGYNRDNRNGQNRDNRGGQNGGRRDGGRGGNSFSGIDAVKPEVKQSRAQRAKNDSRSAKQRHGRDRDREEPEYNPLYGPGGRKTKKKDPNRKGAFIKPEPVVKPEEPEDGIRNIILPEKMTIKELADIMKVQASTVIKNLFMRGEVVTLNHQITYEEAEEIALEYNCIAEMEEKVDLVAELLKEDEEDESLMKKRPPVVCVMGHVDHGKTSLLDAIRKANVTAREAGGITQHIGAYQVNYQGKKIVFLDTPGHEAFTAMRARGAQVTDVAILVVAADDGVMPQTLEAINHAKAAKVPIIVAINKMDRPGANPDHVKQQLAEHELIPEDWGGDTIMVPVSAHQKTGISELLEMILLVAEMQDLKANPSLPAHGTIIEAQLDKGRGPVATVLVQRGTLQIGDTIIAGTAYGKVRAMVNDRGEKVKKALPSTPVEVLGLNDVPLAGDILDSTDEKIARSVAEKRVAKKRIEEIQQNSKVSLDDLFQRIQEGEIKDLNIVVKADVQGTIEALRSSLQNIKNDEVKVVVVHAGVGAITESDVMLASAANALIIGFNVRPDANARKAAEVEKVDVRTYRVIYDALNDVEAAIKGMLAPKFQETIQGRVEVRQMITISKMLIAGCYVLEGKITNTSKVRVVRDGIVINEDEIDTLRRFKDDVKEVAAGYECGVTLEKFRDLKEGDVFEVFTMEEVAVE